MPLKMVYTDQYGHVSTESYWCVVSIYISIIDKVAKFQFCGYCSKSAKENNKMSIGDKFYSLSGDVFSSFSTDCCNDSKPNIFDLIYTYAKSCKDTKRDDGKMCSFFEEATIVP